MASSDNLVKSFRYRYSDELLMFIQKVTIIKRTIVRHCPLQKKKKNIQEKSFHVHNKNTYGSVF